MRKRPFPAIREAMRAVLSEDEGNVFPSVAAAKLTDDSTRMKVEYAHDDLLRLCCQVEGFLLFSIIGRFSTAASPKCVFAPLRCLWKLTWMFRRESMFTPSTSMGSSSWRPSSTWRRGTWCMLTSNPTISSSIRALDLSSWQTSGTFCYFSPVDPAS